MSILPMQKVCPKCKRKYNFNPDVGEGLVCPYCKGSGIAIKDVIKKNLHQASDKRK